MQNDTGRRGFRALPVPLTASGAQRRCGIEIEFAGLDEAATAAIVTACVGGTASQQSEHLYVVEGTALGAVGVELDTRFAKPGNDLVPEGVLDAARPLVPVEIVTPPLTPAQMDRVIPLVQALSKAGAKGTSDSLLAGFGIHFNPEVVDFDHPHTLRTITAYGLLEPWIRDTRPIDLSRRLLPFVDAWPEAFTDALVRQQPDSLGAVARLVQAHLKGRNYGLDLLPLLHAFDPDGFDRDFGKDASGARPAFHFRLPDCRIDEADWSIADEWDSWCRVEELAADSDRLAALCDAWCAGAAPWPEVVARHLGGSGQEART
ncbi:amidoligase family protein [Maliponia aquimaris]|nr:amidoligase family protein [Maliponia aquimaris]